MSRLINNCPNCGSDWVAIKPNVWENGYGQEIKVRYYIECGKCSHKSIESISEIITLQNWNADNINDKQFNPCAEDNIGQMRDYENKDR